MSDPSSNPSGGDGPTTTVSVASAAGTESNADREKIYQWIIELSGPDTREAALLELSKKREEVHDLAPLLWNSFGSMAALLQVSCHYAVIKLSLSCCRRSSTSTPPSTRPC